LKKKNEILKSGIDMMCVRCKDTFFEHLDELIWWWDLWKIRSVNYNRYIILMNTVT